MTTNKRFMVSINMVTNEREFWDYDRHLDCCEVVKLLNNYDKENDELKTELFEARKELLWATSDEVDRVLYYEDEVEELRKEIFND